ncbi:MAG TPA: DedA family protein, partial [Sphingomicrobium sp.]|nr:DedA family protein [Sphingomicrobium sp.]
MSDWVVRLIEQSGYLGVGFLMFLETLFPPIPSEVIMPVAGMAAANGRMNFGLTVAAGTAGAMLGNILWYLAARALGHDR